MRLAGRQHVVVRLVLLQHHPHALDIVAGMAPVALGIEIADEQLVLLAGLDRRHRAGDLARDEGLAADRALVIEQDAVRGMDAVGLAVVHRDPIGVELGGAIGTARRERRGLVLRGFGGVAVELRGRGLIEAHALLHAQDADRLQQPQRAERVGIGGVFRRLEAHLHVALRGEIVDFGRLRLLHQADEIGGIGHVAVVQEEVRAFAHADRHRDDRRAGC